MIELERLVRLALLVTNGPEGAAEEEAENDEETQVVAELRRTKGDDSMIQEPPIDLDFDAADSPDFDWDAWEAAGFPQDRKREFIRDYEPPKMGWRPTLGKLPPQQD